MSSPLGQQSSMGVGVGGVTILPSRDYVAMAGDVFVASPEGGGGMLLASTGRRPGVLLNIQQYTG